MLKRIFILYILLSGISVCYSQQIESNKIFDIYFSQDFNDNTPGIYKFNEWHADWNYPWEGSYLEQNGTVHIIENVDPEQGSNVMRLILPKGSHAGSDIPAGCDWETLLNSSFNELYFSYRIKFKPGFEWVCGGKIPGVRGGPSWDGWFGPPYDGGFVNLPMWSEQPTIAHYYYYHGQTHEYGATRLWNTRIESDKWYTVTLRTVMNTINGGYGNTDAVFEGYINGKLVSQITGFTLRNLASIGIDRLNITAFFGGGEPLFAATRDEWIELDDFIAFTYKPEIDVPRGNVFSPSDRVLLLPNEVYDDSAWRKSITANPVSSKTVNLLWKNYFYPVTYTIQRRELSETSYTDIATLSHPAVFYQNSGLSPNTTYFYRLKTDNSVSDPVQVTTLSPAPPQSPTSLVALQTDKTFVRIRWNDNSNNEVGFIIERSDGNQNNFRQIASVTSNIREYNNTGLSPDNDYYYRVKAYNEDGQSVYTNILSVKTPLLSLPVAPTDPNAVNITSKSFELTWKDNSNNETGFQIYKLDDSDGTYKLHLTVTANIVKAAFSNLQPNTSHSFRIRAYNADGVSGFTNDIKVTTLPIQPPVAPITLILDSITPTSAYLRWTDQSDNENGFEVYRSQTESSGYQLIYTTTANQTTYISNNPEPGGAFFFRVRAYNDIGASAYTNIIKAVTPNSILPPTNLTMKSISMAAVTIGWTNNSNNETGFQIQRGNDGKSFVNLKNVAPNTIQFADSSLQDHSLFFYRIRAYNNEGYSAFSDTLAIQTPEDIIPSDPAALKADLIKYNKVTLSWSVNTTNISGFEIERITGASGNFSRIAKTGKEIVFSDTTVLEGTTYTYRIRSFNAFNYSAYSAAFIADVPFMTLPDSPEMLAPINIETNAIAIKWTDKSVDEKGFIIKRAMFPQDDFETIFQTAPDDTFFVDISVTPNTTYYYVVNAVNENGQSENSNKIRVSTLSLAESLRYKEGLVAYYNFSLNSDTIIHDLSGFENPVNLLITDTTKINWTKNSRFEITENTVVRSLQPATKIVDACKKTNEISLECWIKPSYNINLNNANIISLSQDPENIGISLMQSDYNLSGDKNYRYVLGLRTKSTLANGTPYLTAENNAVATLHHIVYKRDNMGTEEIYLNGKKVANNFKPLGFDNWLNDFDLYLGNDPTMQKPWTGMFYLVAIYNVALTPDQILQNYKAGPTDNIIEPNNKFDIIIFPNPSTGQFSLEIKPLEISEYGETMVLQLGDLNGIVYLEEIIKDSNQQYHKEFNLNHLKKGIYFFILRSSSDIKSQKIVLF